MDKINILVVDDDHEIVLAIMTLLEQEGYQCYGAFDGMEAMEQLEKQEIHLIIMDVMMPRQDGLTTMLQIRQDRNIPIIMLSAKTEELDVILGLSMGADDYISKPYSPNELLARVKSQTRRYMKLGKYEKGSGNSDEELVNGSFCLNLPEKQLYIDGEAVKLTAKEYKIMELFMRNPGVVFSAEEIYEHVWNEEAYSVENTVMVHIRRIRGKVEVNPGDPKYVKVVWGIGYKMEKYS